jgi:fucose permease
MEIVGGALMPLVQQKVINATSVAFAYLGAVVAAYRRCVWL